MSVTIHTFPPVHSFNSRSWVLLLIVMLHLGFFWALTSGLSTQIIRQLQHDFVVVPVPDTPPQDPPRRRKPIDPATIGTRVEQQRLEPRPMNFTWDDEVPKTDGELQPPAGDFSGGTSQPAPTVVSPSIDPALGLSEPTYPAQEIRQQHTGTVLLSVQVLANGRVGEVRIDHSSGYPRLDASAAREARAWRFRPGTSDGVPVVMWKQVPITFRLK